MGVEAGMWAGSRQVISSLQNSNMELAFPNCSKAFHPSSGSAKSRAAVTLPGACLHCSSCLKINERSSPGFRSVQTRASN